jgi:hypothetical protein
MFLTDITWVPTSVSDRDSDGVADPHARSTVPSPAELLNER